MGALRLRHLARLRPDHLLREALHFFKLWTELQQEQVDPRFFELHNAFAHLVRRPGQTGTQTPVRDRVLQRNLLLEFACWLATVDNWHTQQRAPARW
jgi:hypothetical protein